MCTGGSLTQYRMGLLGHVFDLHTGHDSHFGANGAILQCPHQTGPLRHDERSGGIGLMGAIGLDDQVAVYRPAGDHVIALIAGITDAQWNSPALGPWTVRTLVGHIGRAFTTVTEYLARPVAVHSVDLARATGQAAELPNAVCDRALEVSVAAAARRGQGQSVLLALTGREPLPDGFSVV